MTDICQLCKGDHFDSELMHKWFTSLEGSGDHEEVEREREGYSREAEAPLDVCVSSHTEEPIDFSKGHICLDCNKFGNVGRFIRHRPKERKMAEVATAATSSSSQAMLLRRLVYTDAQDRRFPKIALFAARKITASTELLI